MIHVEQGQMISVNVCEPHLGVIGGFLRLVGSREALRHYKRGRGEHHGPAPRGETGGGALGLHPHRSAPPQPPPVQSPVHSLETSTHTPRNYIGEGQYVAGTRTGFKLVLTSFFFFQYTKNIIS